MKNKIILANMIIFASVISLATEVKKGTPIGTLVQTESPERLKQFLITTLKDHRAQLKPFEISDAKNPNIIDPRAVSWGLEASDNHLQIEYLVSFVFRFFRRCFD